MQRLTRVSFALVVSAELALSSGCAARIAGLDAQSDVRGARDAASQEDTSSPTCDGSDDCPRLVAERKIDWCSFWCKTKHAMCTGQCAAGSAMLRERCLAGCGQDLVGCVRDCDAPPEPPGPPPEPPACSTTRCPEIGRLPCCSGYRCCGGACVPRTMHCP